ncbi:MAG: DUF4830 domain-containing protein [Ruminococcus sp.]|nr:DUF4830 domain-containing protein [Ruminococcus sp.]
MKIIPILLISTALITSAVVTAHILQSREDSPEEVFVPASTVGERMDYFASHGWETAETGVKDITIPAVFSEEYEEYARIQDKQGLPLRRFAGRNGQLYSFEVRNYSPENRRLLAELIVCDGIAAASMIYSEDGETLRMAVQ